MGATMQLDKASAKTKTTGNRYSGFTKVLKKIKEQSQ